MKIKAKAIDEDKMSIIYEIRKLNAELEEAYRSFQYQTDDDLLEASIYRIKELRAKHSYLIRLAREYNISALYMKFEEKEYAADA